MSVVTSDVAGTRWAWLRNPAFDSFVRHPGADGHRPGRRLQPILFVPIVIIDLWLFGYHHVIATYTRLCFDRKSFSEHWPLIVVFLPLVAIGTLAVAYFVGLWVIVSIYFYWQWFHYTRQSWGISRVYRGKQRGALYEDGGLDQAIFYALTVLGISIARIRTRAVYWYGTEGDPGSGVVHIAAVAAVALIGLWALRRLQAWREGRLAVVHTFYMLSHFGIFLSVNCSSTTSRWLADDEYLAQCAVHIFRLDV